MPSGFKPNPAFEAQLKREVAYKAALLEPAEEVARTARATAHRIMPAGRGEQIQAESFAGEVVVANHNHGGHLDEWGSKNNPPYAPLRRAVRSAGLRFREE